MQSKIFVNAKVYRKLIQFSLPVKLGGSHMIKKMPSKTGRSVFVIFFTTVHEQIKNVVKGTYVPVKMYYITLHHEIQYKKTILKATDRFYCQ